MSPKTDPLRAHGTVALGVLTLIVLLGAGGGWAALTRISGAIIASGRVEVAQNRQVVQHPNGGVIASLAVKEGIRVNAGDTLMTLDPNQHLSELLILEGLLFEVMARRGRLEAEREGRKTIAFDPVLRKASKRDTRLQGLMQGQRRLFAARNTSLSQQMAQLGKRRGQIADQIIGITAQKTAAARQIELIEQDLKDQVNLFERGLTQAARVRELKREQARLQGMLGELIARKAQAEGLITEIEIETFKIGSTRRETAISHLRDQHYREMELTEQRRALKQQLAQLEIKAPVSGIVYGLQVFALRAVIRAAEPVLYIVPQDRPLVVAAQVAPIYIDQLSIGQAVFLRFSALDQNITPELLGQVTQISADTFQNDAAGGSYYRVEIALTRGETARLPQGVSLRPGMPVETYIKTNDRSPLTYLIKPLSNYFAKAFRER